MEPGEPSSAGGRMQSDSSTAWAKVNVLTFDGGGIKGYFSLLVMKELMRYIQVEEERFPKSPGTNRITSFDPCPEPANVSHCESPTAPFLPCHYFDYIGGTSTGALITVMLARFRMPVQDCLDEYEALGGVIFGEPRSLYVRSTGVLSRHKYATRKLEKAIKDVISRRGEMSRTGRLEALRFQTPTGLCRAIVLALQSSHSKLGKGDYIKTRVFRSFHLFEKKSREPNTQVEGPAPSLAVWKVARGAVAAPTFFRPLAIEYDTGDVLGRADLFKIPADQVTRLTDCGVGRDNNPSVPIHDELDNMLSKSPMAIDTFISVGAGRRRTTRKATIPLQGTVAEHVHFAGDPEVNHDIMEGRAERNGLAYFRFDVPDGLEMEMDDWEPRKPSSRSGVRSGATTIAAITAAFNSWKDNDAAKKAFRECATRLVACRRSRADDQARWGRFALGTSFVCSCAMDVEYIYRSDFDAHVSRAHPGTEQEPLKTQWQYKEGRGSS